MASLKGISFLYSFDLGNRDVENPGANIISVTSQAVGDFEPANMFEDSTRRQWRSADSINEQIIVIKADKKSQIDTFAILGHNLSETAVVRVEANVNNNFVAPPFSQVIPVDTESENLVLANDGFGGEYEYYRVRILDPANACGYIEIGRIIGGVAFTFEGNEDITDDVNVKHIDESESMRTQGYFRASNENVLVRQVDVNFSKIKTVTGENDNYLAFRKMFKTVKTTRPFLLILNRVDPTILNMWCQLTDLPSERFGINRFVDMPLSMEEVF